LNGEEATDAGGQRDALKETIARYGVPEIMNTDQAVHRGRVHRGHHLHPDAARLRLLCCGHRLGQAGGCSRSGCCDVLREHDIRISMDGKGCWRDNVFVERLWKTIKYEHVYLHAYESVSEARTKITTYLAFYDVGRPQSRIDRRTPDDAYFDVPSLKAAA
jgi:transposase InsO family protein